MLGLSIQPTISPPVALRAPIRLELRDTERETSKDATLAGVSSHGIMFDDVDAYVPTGAPLTLRFNTRDHRLGIAAGQIVGTDAGLMAIRFVHANTTVLQLARDLFQLRPFLREGFLSMVVRGGFRVDVMPSARLAPSDLVAAAL